MLVYQDPMKDTVFNFFKSQKDLKVIRLGLKGANNREMKQLIFHILESCSKLEEFRLEKTPWEPMNIEDSEISRFVSLISKLKFMDLPFNPMSPSSDFSCLALKSHSMNLISLKLEFVNIDLCAAILRGCTSLQHLALATCVDDTLQTIFQYLVSELLKK